MLGREAGAVLVCDVDHRTGGLREQPALRLEVLVHRAVEVEVVLRQVREHEHREPCSFEPALRGCHRRRLHHAGAVAAVEHLAEQPLQVDRLGRVQPDLAHLVADPAFDVRQEPRFLPRRCQHRREQIGRGRLAVRAGDRRDRKLCRRIAEELDRSARHGRAHVRHDELRHVDVEDPLHDERCRPVLHRRTCEVVAVRPCSGDAEEE